MNVRIAKKILSRPEAYPPHQVRRANQLVARQSRVSEGNRSQPAPAQPSPAPEPAPAPEPPAEDAAADAPSE